MRFGTRKNARLLRGSILAAALALAVGGISGTADAHYGGGGGRHGTSCENLTRLKLADTTVTSAQVVKASGSTPEYCAVQATVAHAPTYTDAVHVGVFLPTRNWNGRFEGTGGGGFSGGNPSSPDTGALQAGYATAGTDAGHSGGSGSFALGSDGNPDWASIDDFGYAGVHDMTVTSKAVVDAFYGSGPRYSYFNGCSTGGRQGLIEAQLYPSDYDGIAAGSPAINSTILRTVQMWGEVQMQLAGDFIPQCKLAAFNAGAVAACDTLDKVKDGIISDWQDCDYDARRLIGTKTDCGTITATDADIVNKIWAGPVDSKGNRLWYGLMKGADFSGLNNTRTAADGTTTGAPFSASSDWYKYFLNQDPGFDWHSLTPDKIAQAFLQSVSEYGAFDPTAAQRIDLTPFRDAGGKLVMWSGTTDQLVYQEGDQDYYQRVEATAGGTKATQKFARFYWAPGVAHCGGGAGAAPTDAFQSVVNWVEHGKAPDQLSGEKTDASGAVVMTRPVCMYPEVAAYKGRGSTDQARNFRCSTRY